MQTSPLRQLLAPRLTALSHTSAGMCAVAGLAGVAAVGMLDYLTGYEVAFSPFYLFPIALVTWHGGRRLGLLLAFTSAAVWLLADVATRPPYSHVAIHYWNSCVRLGVFVILALLLDRLRLALAHEKELARVDHLTGAVNARCFSEIVDAEIVRSRRQGQPFTVVYLDLDNFKKVNDRFGHSVGDRVLTTFVERARGPLRECDVVARLGGDEFALLLPATGQGDARVVLSRLEATVSRVMAENDWPVTLSAGVVTFVDATGTADEVLRQVDELMYQIKNGGKNSMAYALSSGPACTALGTAGRAA